MPLELATFNPTSALLGLSSPSVDRIELCADPSVGGITPTLADFMIVKQATALSIPISSPNPTLSEAPSEPRKTPINVMIRPRGGDFVYTHEEFTLMEREMEILTREGADGFVFGILSGPESNLRIDVERCRVLIERAGGRPVTFHRAVDALPVGEMEGQLEVLVELGFKAVLTSGGIGNAVQGKSVLKGLVKSARGRIDVIVGGGVRSVNLPELKREVGAEWWHSSAVVDGGEVASEEEIKALGACLIP